MLRRSFVSAAIVLGLSGTRLSAVEQPKVPADLDAIRARQIPLLKAELTKNRFPWAAPIFIRIFKESHELELWVRTGNRFDLFKTYPICNYSGKLGPKRREGDLQSPEGFYLVGPEAMNPESDYHLSFNLGFPNPYDRAYGRTGSYLMVHGDCTSIGCYAMTDPVIEEIYLMAEAAFAGGQPVFWVHAFPFRMTEKNLARYRKSLWANFWHNMREGNDLFEETGRPPVVSTDGRRYVFWAEG